MQWLAEICVRRPIFATVLTLLIVVLGIAGYSRLGVDQFPNVDLPIVAITTILPGASPQDIETDVSDKIESAVNTIGNIEELRSISTESMSLVIVQFKLEQDVNIAAQDVRDRIDRIMSELPDDVEKPVVAKLDPDASPIVYAALTAEGRSIREITEYADQKVRESLEVLPGVGQVRIVGGSKRTLHVWLDPIRLRSLNVAPGEVARAIGTENVNVPGGRIDTGREQLTLRVHGRVESTAEIGKIAVRTAGDHVIRVEDVARVEDGSEETASAALWNGEPTVMLAIRKQSGANTIAVADAIAERLGELRAELPLGYKLETTRDASGVIRTGTNSVKEHLVVGALLAALVVLAFLGNWRSTIIAAVAIPTSVIGTFAVMAALDYTLNTITLLALALSVGIVIDDAIVVLENIFRFVEEKGRTPMRAAVEGTKEIGLAVLATTLSLIAVFMPVAFLAGIPGRFLRSFGITMSIAIAVSLFVSFSLTPMLASRWLRAKVAGEHEGPQGLEKVVEIFYRPIERVYMRALGFAMRHRWVVVLACAASMATLPIFGGMAKKGFLPVDDRAQFEVLVRAPEGSSIETTKLYGERLAEEVRRVEGVAATLTTVAADDQAIENVARVFVKLTDPTTRELSQDALMEKTRKEIVSHQPKELRIQVQIVPDFGGSGQSTARIQYNLTGPDLERLSTITNEVVAKLAQFPGAVDVDSSLVVGKPELGVYIDRAKAAELGVGVTDIAMTLRMLVGGMKVGTYEENGEQYDIRMRSASEYRNDPATLGLLSVPSAKVGSVNLLDVVHSADGTGPSSINRLARQRTVLITANAAPGIGDSVIGDELQRIVTEMNLPSSYSLKPVGQTKLMMETAQSVLFGFGLAFIFMYLILAAQFESWLHPFTILLSLPLTLPFAVLSIVITGQALDMFSVLGIFVLFGIVKKNSILQIDHTNQLRAHGLPRLEAILQANKDRLRPILMTTVAFVAGMLPLVLSDGVGSGFNKATAGVVVGGQTLSLLLTLLATPVAYSLLDDLMVLLRRLLVRVGIMSEEVAELDLEPESEAIPVEGL